VRARRVPAWQAPAALAAYAAVVALALLAALVGGARRLLRRPRGRG
jgi:uncharacterized integral membrane protein